MKHFVRTLLATVFFACSSLPLAVMAAELGTEQAIRERISSLEQAWAKGDADYVATRVYGSDVVIQGEGQKETVRTAAAALDVIRHLVADSKSVKLDIDAIKPLGAQAAYSWVTWRVTPRADAEKPFDVKALFVWTKGKEGWRIRADMYSLGSM